MGKVKKAKSCSESEKSVNPEVLAISNTIKKLAEKDGLIVTDKCAVFKELHQVGSLNAERNYTRWAKNAEGECVLVVLHDDHIKVYPNYKDKFSSMKTIKTA